MGDFFAGVMVGKNIVRMKRGIGISQGNADFSLQTLVFSQAIW